MSHASNIPGVALLAAGVAAILQDPTFAAALAIDLIDVSDNARTDLGDLTEMADSIREGGVRQPISVIRNGSRYTLWYGHRRFFGSKLAGKTTIPALVHDEVSPTQFKVGQLVENLNHEAMSEQDVYRTCAELEALGLARQDIGKRIGKSAGTVTRILSPDDCPIEVKELFLAGRLTLGQCYKIGLSDEPLATMELFLAGATREEASTKAKTKKAVAAVRTEKIKCPLASGVTVQVSGRELSLEEAIEALGEAEKAMKLAIKRGLNVKTAAAFWKDTAAAGC